MTLIKKYSQKQPQKGYKKISFYKRLQARHTKQYQSKDGIYLYQQHKSHFLSSLKHITKKTKQKNKCQKEK